MQFRLGGELGRMVEEEAKVRGMSGPMLVKAIVGEWFMDTYKKRTKRVNKLQEQAVGGSEGVLGGEVAVEATTNPRP